MERTFRLGHVHLKVVNLDLAIEFYTQILGFRVTKRVETYCFLSYGSDHHNLAIHSIRGEAAFPTKNSVGLYHFAVEAPTFEEFRRVFGVLQRSGVATKAVNHGISKALYFTDPDGNGIEVFFDTRAENNCFEWRGVSIPISESELLL